MPTQNAPNRPLRARLATTTAGFSGALMDADGEPITGLNLRNLPLIERDAIPGLPDGIEARLWSTAPVCPTIVLWHRTADLHVEFPVTALADAARFIAALESAVLRQAMGEAPEQDGYRIAPDVV